MTGTHLITGAGLPASGTNYTPIGIIAVVLVPVCAAIAVVAWSYFRLQWHRADAVAMAEYRKLAEEAVESLAGLRAELAALSRHVSAVEQLMREVG